jgi:3-hydroxyisobutyrate dehydrogenase-like beta-hydroxyacid dehydrogenase
MAGLQDRTRRTAFIGLGVMGFPMAGHLADAGHMVTVYNRTRAKAEAWANRHRGNVAASPAAAAREAEIVFTCVGNDDDLRSVVLGADGVLSGLGRGGILVDHTTASGAIARECAQAAAERRQAFLDAPVSGGQSGAEAGQLSIMVGGDETVFDQAEPVMAAYAKAVTWMGPTGSGQLAKMVNQICIAGLAQGLAEGLSFAERAGLDITRLIAAISKGAAQSWTMENRWQTMILDEFDFGFAVDWMRKDMGMILDESRRNGAILPVTVLVDQFFAALQHRGGGRLDITSLIRLLR